MIYFRDWHPFNVHPLTVGEEYIMFWKFDPYNFSIRHIRMFGGFVYVNNKLGSFIIVLFIVRHITKITRFVKLCNTSF
jgi:hypothetical protein